MIRRTLLIALILCATSLHATEQLRVIAPAADEVLRGGHFATLTWTADTLPAGAEEWEAFVSVDGGKYYGARLTPHLDVDVRSFEFLVPNVDSNDVRILIRTGDEIRETIIELPQRFRIRAERSVALPAATKAATPEAARPGDKPVAMWASGDRSGSAVVQNVAPAGVHIAARRTTGHSSRTFAPSPRGERVRAIVASAPVRSRTIASAHHFVAAARDVLLLSTRMNV